MGSKSSAARSTKKEKFDPRGVEASLNAGLHWARKRGAHMLCWSRTQLEERDFFMATFATSNKEGSSEDSSELSPTSKKECKSNRGVDAESLSNQSFGQSQLCRPLQRFVDQRVAGGSSLPTEFQLGHRDGSFASSRACPEAAGQSFLRPPTSKQIRHYGVPQGQFAQPAESCARR